MFLFRRLGSQSRSRSKRQFLVGDTDRQRQHDRSLLADAPRPENLPSMRRFQNIRVRSCVRCSAAGAILGAVPLQKWRARAVGVGCEECLSLDQPPSPLSSRGAVPPPLCPPADARPDVPAPTGGGEHHQLGRALRRPPDKLDLARCRHACPPWSLTELSCLQQSISAELLTI